MNPNQYLLDLPYIEWHLISDIPDEIADEVIGLIDEGFRYRYRYNDDWTAFKKHLKYENKEHGLTGRTTYKNYPG